MTVNITISETSAGSSVPDTIDMGTVTPGEVPSPVVFQDLFIRHDASVNPITDCNFYITRYVGSTYLGSDADADLSQILGWGDSGSGAQINQACPEPWVEGAAFDSGSWTSFSNSTGNVNSPIELVADAIVGGASVTDGEIAVGEEAHVQVRIIAPASPGSAGVKAFALVMSYSATS